MAKSSPTSSVQPGYDGTPLAVRAWSPERATPRAVVLLVHGYAEHSGRYEALAHRLSAHGFAVMAYDHRGHGRSGGPTALVPSFDEYVADLHGRVQHARERWAGRPLFLFGHSMGGAVVLLYCLDHGAAPAGLVLSSPLLRLPDPPALQRVARVVGRLAPALPTTHLDRDALSRDEAVVQAVADDPLCYPGRVKAGMAREMIGATRRLAAAGHALALPFLLFHGTGDRITDPDGSRALYGQAPSADKTLVMHDGFYHETFRDPGGARVLRQLVDWLSERAPT